MKAIKTILICLTLLNITLLSQDWPTAPEVWSEPVLLDSVFNKPFNWLESPSLTENMDTLYLDMSDGIYYSIKKEAKWQEPVKLNSNINPGGVATRYSSISKDGKRLYFSGWGGYGGWDLWYSDWDDSTNDWSIGINMGPEINSGGFELYLYELTDDSIYVIGSSENLRLYIRDEESNKWQVGDYFTYHPLGGVEMYGVSLTENRNKMYFGKRRWEKEWAIDLCVTYWDTTENYWGDVYYLNINTQTVPWQNITKRGGEFYPWISADGKVMVFASNRNVTVHPDSGDNTTNLFISYLLVDENGDTVTSVENISPQLVNSFSLMHNYPNPFNPSTTISYTLKQGGLTKLIIYDSLGRRITSFVNEVQTAGEHEIVFNAEMYNLSSGVYYYQLIQNKNYAVKKMVLAK